MRACREERGLSLEAVAKKIGSSKGHLSAVETGEGNIGFPLFFDYCNAIHTPPHKVLEQNVALAKHRDLNALVLAFIERHGFAELRWLAELSRDEAAAAMKGAHDAVDLVRLRASQRKGDPVSKRG
jgi:transcriptional regulator with XRE-family HTH domain